MAGTGLNSNCWKFLGASEIKAVRITDTWIQSKSNLSFEKNDFVGKPLINNVERDQLARKSDFGGR